MNKYFELIILIAVLGFVAIAKTSEKHEPAYVLMISFDGFRHDYVEKYDAPHFKAFIEKGAKAEALTPSFPSKTFPNHYSLVTGMYPGNHGLVDNSFYDEELDVVYRASKRELVENPAFYGGLPLWQLTQQNGMKSASYFWVGSEAPVAGSFPDYYYIYDGSVSNEARIDEVVRWLNLPEEDRPHFISLYFSLVDSLLKSAKPCFSKKALTAWLPPPAFINAISRSVQLSIKTDRTKDMCVPRPRWTPEHLKQKSIPSLGEPQSGRASPQSTGNARQIERNSPSYHYDTHE